MVTINHVVKAELSASPLIADLLNEGLLNVSALAEKIQPRIETILKRKVKKTAISMAIRRETTELNKSPINKWRFPTNISVTTKSNLYEVSFENNPHVAIELFKLQRNLTKRSGSFISIVEGINETVSITNQSNKNEVLAILKKAKIISEKDGLGYVSIDFEPFTKDIPGIYYRMTRELAFNNISIQSMHTIGAEVIFLFEGKDLLRAHETIDSLIKNKQT